PGPPGLSVRYIRAPAALPLPRPTRSPYTMTESFAGAYNRDLLDEVYRQYRENPAAVDPTWRAFFAGMEFSSNGTAGAGGSTAADIQRQTATVRIVTAYRELGHLQAHIDPLNPPPPPSPMLRLDRFGITPPDLGATVDVSMYFGMNGAGRLGELIDALRETYCRTLGVEY